MSPEPSTGQSRTSAALALFHTCVLAVFPVVNVVTANAGVYPLNSLVIARSLLAVLAAVALLLGLLRFVGWSLLARTAWLSVFLLGANVYSSIPVPRVFEGRVGSGGAWFNLAFLFLCGGVASLVVRPWQLRRRDPVPLVIVAVVLLAFDVAPVVDRLKGGRESWRRTADAMTATSGVPNANLRPERDVYLIILDTFGRPDVLREYYGIDLDEFVSDLKARGFEVPARSRGNYSQTFLAVSAMLNLQYLDTLAEALGQDSRDRRPLKYLIENNRLMKLAKSAGYRVVAIGSDYTATEAFPLADDCFCSLPSPHELEYIALRISGFADFGRERWVTTGRRRHVLSSFAALERAGTLPGRKLVVAHLLTPHPPFVFDHKGNARRPPGHMPFIHEETVSRRIRSRPEFAKEYIEGYSQQTAFVAARVGALIRTLLSRPGPSPAIMIVGDHGPALELDVLDHSRTNLRERMSVLSAYHLPGEGWAPVPQDLSPVNGARLLASRYMKADTPPLPERSAFSTFVRPYDLMILEPED